MGKRMSNPNDEELRRKNNPRRKQKPSGFKAKTVDQDAMDLTKRFREQGVEEVMKTVGGKKQKDGSYVFKSTGGLINGRPTGKGKGAARSI
tara:strand:+ start:880 stop:1152 length:273 start_codon:yes stop_codon:yes gene_type:complete